MVTLKELLKTYGNLMDDSAIIMKWFLDNEAEDLAIKCLSKIAETKIDKLKMLNNTIVGNLNCYVPFVAPNKGWSNELILAINRTNIRLIGNLEPIPSDLELLKEEIPKHKTPKLFWTPLISYLRSLGIYFKEYMTKEVDNYE